ncbi:MAG: adenylyltransferase/cytidyltransferase family protein [Chloroflexota bacterium]
MHHAVLDLGTLRDVLDVARTRGERIVLTNGIFDILHVGHLRYLRAARAEGDLLIVGVNSDRTVRKPGRPLVPHDERAELVAALDPVDYSTIFDEDTADGLLRVLRPDIYVKGGDYTERSLPEAVTARGIGARLVFIPLVPEHSTNRLIEFVRSRRGRV